MSPGAASAKRYAVILAGGRGERFWPLSRERRPKQLLTLVGGRSLLRQAVDRVSPLIPAENVFVITNARQLTQVRRAVPRLRRANVIAEPCGRDTTAAVALGAALVGRRSPDGVLAVLPADQLISDAAAFRRVLRDAFALAARQPVTVTFGIKPTEPATAYGYIQLGAPLSAAVAPGGLRTSFAHAEHFVEKPPVEKAREYFASGRYRWNGGIFVWSCPALLDGLASHAPPFAAAARRWIAARTSARLARLLAADYPQLPRISIDFSLLERARNVVVAEATFPWDDLGSWTALGRHLPADAQGNCAVGDFAQVDASNNIIFDARTRGRGLIALVGVRDAIVVQTDDATLIAKKDQAQKIKDLVKLLVASTKRRRLI